MAFYCSPYFKEEQFIHLSGAFGSYTPRWRLNHTHHETRNITYTSHSYTSHIPITYISNTLHVTQQITLKIWSHMNSNHCTTVVVLLYIVHTSYNWIKVVVGARSRELFWLLLTSKKKLVIVISICKQWLSKYNTSVRC